MQIVVFANGQLESFPDLVKLIDEADLIMAADGGAAHCADLGIVPHVAVGDFDSIAPELLDAYSQAGVEIHRHPAEKDATDLELALDLAMAKGARVIWLLAALGGRWDMSMANIMLAAGQKYRELSLALAARECCMRIFHPGQDHVVERSHGRQVSLLPLRGEVGGVRLSGFRYPLREENLGFGSSRGVSNVLVDNCGTVRHRNGVLLCIQYRDD